MQFSSFTVCQHFPAFFYDEKTFGNNRGFFYKKLNLRNLLNGKPISFFFFVCLFVFACKVKMPVSPSCQKESSTFQHTSNHEQNQKLSIPCCNSSTKKLKCQINHSPSRAGRRASLESSKTLAKAQYGTESPENILQQLLTISLDNSETPITFDGLLDLLVQMSSTSSCKRMAERAGFRFHSSIEFIKKRSPNISQFEVIRLLAMGSVSKVYLVKDKSSGFHTPLRK